MSAKDDEVISEGDTKLRRSGNVDVVTVPSHISKTNPVRRRFGKLLHVQLVKRNGRYFLEIGLEDKLK